MTKKQKKITKNQHYSKTILSRKNRPVDILTDDIASGWKKSFVYVRKTEVATWKGGLVLMFIAGIAAALIWSAKTQFNDFSEAAADSTIYFSPASTSVVAGENFTLTAMINPGSNQVSGAELHVTYDHTKFSLNSITAPSAPANCTNTPTFSVVLQSASINNTNGTASITIGVCTATPPAPVVTTTTVATFSFHALAATTALPIAFASSTFATAIGEAGDVISTRTPANITVTAPDADGPTFTINDGTSASWAKSDTINITVADATGVASRFYGFSTDSTCNSSDTINTAFTSGTNFTISGNHNDYLCLKATDSSANGNVSYRLVGQLYTDNAAPTGGSFTINSNAAYTNSTAATLNITCPSDQWSTVQMAFGTSASPTNWTTCAASQAQTLASGDGLKTVYVRFRDGGSNTTSDLTKTITIDTAVPTGGSASISAATSFLHSVLVAVADGTDSGSGIDTSSRAFQRRSATISAGACGTYSAWSSATLVGTYSAGFADSSIIAGNCYEYRYLVKDNAGNQATATVASTAKIAYLSDTNLDGAVNLFDYNILFEDFGSTNCDSLADIIDDCSIDLFDYNQMFIDFGKSLI